jgi:hypothetical protein
MSNYIAPTSIEKIATMSDEQLFEMKTKLSRALVFYRSQSKSKNINAIDSINNMLEEIQNQEHYRQYNKMVTDLSKMKGRKGQPIKDPSVIMDDIEEEKFNEDDW